MELITLENVKTVLEEYAQEVRNTYQDKLITNDRISSGKLLNSVEYQVEFNGVEYEVKLTLEKYWKYIEYGVKGDSNTTSPYKNPGWKAYPHILEWVTTKPVLPRPGKKKLKRPESLAGAITASIVKNGILPGGELKDTVDEINKRYKDKLVIALHKDTETLLKVVLGGIQGTVPMPTY